MQNNLTALVVVAAALLGEDRRVLMQRRSLNAIHGGLWEFPGGKIDPGESPEAALVREISEELGVALDQDDLRPLGFASGTTAGPNAERALVILLYTCRRWDGLPQCLEGEEIAWVAVDRLASLDMPPLDYPLAERLAQAIAFDCD